MKKNLTQRNQLPKLFTRAEVRSETFNEKSGTFQVVWSKGAEVKRSSWDYEYYESLSLDPAHVRMDRLRAGAPLLKNHNGWSLDSVIGVVEQASIDGRQGTADVRFSERTDVDPIKKDVRDKILRNISVGYVVHKYKDISERDEKGLVTKRRLLAVDWEPYEISIVPMGADPSAQIRSDKNEFFPVTIEGDAMEEKDIKNDPAPTPTPTEPVQEPKKEDDYKRGIEEERKRVSSINEMVRKVNLPQDFSEKLVSDGVGIGQARMLVIEELAKRSNESRINNNVRVDVGAQDETVTRKESIENSLLNRFDAKKYPLSDAGKKYRNMSLIELSRDFLRGSGVNVSNLSRNEIAVRSLHSTSDFPQLLANVANKTLRDGYQATPQTFGPFVRWVNAPDFKEMTRVQMGEAPVLQEVKESGEYTRGTIKEGGEKYKIKTFGKIIGITRQVIINDDLDAFTRIPQMIGVQTANLESDLFWSIVTNNPTMADSVALFHANHSNLAGSGAAIDVTTLSNARKAMRKQKGLDKKTRIAVEPRYLVVPSDLETVAEQYLAINVRETSTKATDVNPFSGKFILVVEDRLTDSPGTATAWFVFSEVGLVDMVEIATLDGMRGPSIETRMGFDVDGVEVRATYDIGAKVIDYRGFYKNAGA